MTTRQQIIDAARSYRGCRYHHQGRTRAGIDCAGLLVCVARDVGISTAGDQMGYSRTPDGASLKQALDNFGIRVDAFQPGDFLLMRFDAQPQHIAIVTDVGIIHSYLSARRVVEHGLSDDWRARIVQAYAFPGVE
jgi:cell wall-associated NlpC family hydrolase